MHRTWLVFAFALAACHSDSSPAPDKGAPAAAPVVAHDDLCHRTLDVITTATCHDVGFARGRKSLESALHALGLGTGADASQYDLVCARLFRAIEVDARARKCVLTVDADLRAKLDATLAAYFAQRTPVTPTGDAAADATLAKLAAVRDQACACADQPCLEALTGKLGDLTLGPTAPPAARSLASKLLDDVLRCQEHLKLQ